MSAEVHETILSFCIENNIPQNKAVALLRDIVEDMNGDGDNYDFSFVATAYAASQNAAQQGVQPTIATAALEDSPFETGMRRNAVVLSKRNSG